MSREQLFERKKQDRAEALAEAIKAAMKEAEMTPGILAKLLTMQGLPTSHVAVRWWIAAERTPRPRALAAIERILNKDFSQYV